MMVPNQNFEIPFNQLTTLKSIFSQDQDLLIFDVGANDGAGSLEYLNTFPNSHIVAFEPCVSAFSALMENIDLKPRIRAVNLALSDSNGKEILYVHPFNMNKTSSLNRLAKSSNSIQNNLHPKINSGVAFIYEQPTITQTLDSWLSENLDIQIKLTSFCSLLKIDVQGAELRVLQGAEKVLRENPFDVIRLELTLDDVYEIPNDYVPGVFSLLYSANYILYDVSHIYKDLDRARTLWMDLIFVQGALI